MNRIITSEVLIAYSQCPRKAFLLLCTNHKGTMHEYAEMIDHKAQENQQQFISDFRQRSPDIQPYSISNLKNGADFLTNVKLQAEGLEATCGLLTKVSGRSSIGNYHYEPTIFVGTHKVSKEQKLALFFAGHVLGLVQNKSPLKGKIVGADGKSHLVKLENRDKVLLLLLEPLQEWADMPLVEPAPIILNKHCSTCQFRNMCRKQAEQEDNLSLLDRVTPKVIRKYEKKGIFTVRQLSYLYKLRRRKKRAKKHAVTHKIELQALAIRTGKIYLQDVPEVLRQPVELFLDIEGIPDQQAFYLIGLLVCETDTCTYHSFWADTLQDEALIWQQFLEMVDQYRDAPIYHYGSYEPRALAQLSRRYKSDGEALKDRLVNVNTYIYGRVYFPIRSNRLKNIGEFIGASWTAKDASGLQSLVWRHHWDETQNTGYQQILLTYNEEDCRALMLLTDELTRIKNSAATLSEIDFADQPKRQATEVGEEIHSQFGEILKFAHADYDKRKISFRWETDIKKDKAKRGGKKGHQAYLRVTPRAGKIIRVPRRRMCPKHKGVSLQSSENLAERTIIDLIFTKNGVRKVITKYIGTKSYCPRCYRYYDPHGIIKLGNQLFGHGFQSWVIYQRLFLRLPYRVIVQVLEDQFNEKISEGTVVNFLKYFADYYTDTERILMQHILDSPFVHVDETKINIQGIDQYVWVFADEHHVVFRLTETREATIIHDLLYDYEGVLISDFYPGFDSAQCRQQKCWVHLIRDMNNDLWGAPFDGEYEAFVLEVRSLILPIMEAVQKYGLKKRNLNKFRRSVEKFYDKVIVGRHYKSELTLKYRTRFVRYRESLFTFLEQDGIPWHNNVAERALRHLAVQRKISGTFFESKVHQYLILLGIMQTCRFQDKPLLKFLLSSEKDVDSFKKPRPIRNSKKVGKGAEH